MGYRNKKENQRQLMESFLQDLLFRIKEKKQRDLLVEVLLSMQGVPRSDAFVTPSRLEQARFEVFKMSASGNVPVGAIRGIEQATKVLLCLNSMEADCYFLREAASGQMVPSPGSMTGTRDSPAYLN